VPKLLRRHLAGDAYDRLLGCFKAMGEKVRIEISEAKTGSLKTA
jgi:hypothetical protein